MSYNVATQVDTSNQGIKGPGHDLSYIIKAVAAERVAECGGLRKYPFSRQTPSCIVVFYSPHTTLLSSLLSPILRVTSIRLPHTGLPQA